MALAILVDPHVLVGWRLGLRRAVERSDAEQRRQRREPSHGCIDSGHSFDRGY
jgi:hypothetical protein